MSPEQEQKIARLVKDVEVATLRATEAEAGIAVHVAKAEQAAIDYQGKIDAQREIAAEAAANLQAAQDALAAAQAEADTFPSVDELPSLDAISGGTAGNAAIVTEESA